MSILQSTDFLTGQYKIPQDSFTDIETYIEKFEEPILLDMLGVELYDLFKADLTSPTPQIPQDALFLKIFNPFYYDNNGMLVMSEGIKKMLVSYIYFYYTRDNRARNTKSGIMAPAVEVSIDMGYNGYNIVEAWNNGVEIGKAIQQYIMFNLSDYPTFKGQYLQYISGI